MLKCKTQKDDTTMPRHTQTVTNSQVSSLFGSLTHLHIECRKHVPDCLDRVMQCIHSIKIPKTKYHELMNVNMLNLSLCPR